MCPNWAQPVKVFAADGRKLRPISGLWAELLTKPRSVRHNPILFGELLRLLPSIARCCCHYTEKCRLAGKRDGGNCYRKTRAGATDAAGPVAEPSVPVAAPDRRGQADARRGATCAGADACAVRRAIRAARRRPRSHGIRVLHCAASANSDFIQRRSVFMSQSLFIRWSVSAHKPGRNMNILTALHGSSLTPKW